MWWHSLGQHKVCSFLLFNSLLGLLSELWPLGQQCSSSTSSNCAQAKTNQVFSVLYPVTTAEGKCRASQKCQGSSSRDTVSQGTFCQRSEMEMKWSEVIFCEWENGLLNMMGNNLSNKLQQTLTVFAYACQAEFGCIRPQRSASSKEYRADEPEKRQLWGYSEATWV